MNRVFIPPTPPKTGSLTSGQTFPEEGPARLFQYAGYIVFATTTPLCHCIAKAAVDNT